MLFKRIFSLLLAVSLTVGAVGDVSAFAEYSDDVSEYIRWTGVGALAENQGYYIDTEVKIANGERLVVPEGCSLIIKDGGSLLVSGELIALSGSRVENHGVFAATKSSAVELSSMFLNYGDAAFSGEVNVYRTGAVQNHGRLSFSKSSDVTVTGEVACQKGGVMFLKGEFTVTLNGKLRSDGKLLLYCHAAIGGTVTLGEGSDFEALNSARMKFARAARLVDDRNGSVRADVEASYDEYDNAPEDVHWLGIDVSRYQGNIDWERVKAAGVDFVFLRSSIGDGTDSITGEDIRFAVNAVEAKEAGLMVGAYHYLWAETVEDARKEARFFVKTIAPYDLDFPAVLDFEDPTQQENLTNEERTAIAKAFLEEVRNAGYYPMLYASRSWAVGYLNMDELSEYDVWLAEWFPEPSYTGDFGIWQYTAVGRVSGIDGDVDLNVCYKNYRKLINN